MASLKATVCSANPHKLDEFGPLFPGWELELLVDAAFPEENGATYVDNARIKARYGREVGPAGRWMLADDSGIELAALAGGPGVLTARWAAGRHVERALDAVEGRDRRARYVCELVALSPDGREVRRHGRARRDDRAGARRERGLRLRPGLRPGRARRARSPSSATRGRPSTPTAPAPRGPC